MRAASILIVTASIFVFSQSYALEARGAKKRTRIVEPTQMDVDDVIRAEEDPDFEAYLKTRDKEQKEQQAEINKYKKERQAQEESAEKERRQFVKSRIKEVPEEETPEYKARLKEEQAWEVQAEKNRAEYVKNQDSEAQKRSQRFPASLRKK